MAPGNYCTEYIHILYVLATDAPAPHQIHQRPKLLAWEERSHQETKTCNHQPGPRGCCFCWRNLTKGHGRSGGGHIHTVCTVHAYGVHAYIQLARPTP